MSRKAKMPVKSFNKDAPLEEYEDGDCKHLARSCTVMAMATLMAVCQEGRNEGARISAAKEILDRGWGKAKIEPEQLLQPHQQINVVFQGEPPKQDQIVSVTTTKPRRKKPMMIIDSGDDGETST